MWSTCKTTHFPPILKKAELWEVPVYSGMDEIEVDMTFMDDFESPGVADEFASTEKRSARHKFISNVIQAPSQIRVYIRCTNHWA